MQSDAIGCNMARRDVYESILGRHQSDEPTVRRQSHRLQFWHVCRSRVGQGKNMAIHAYIHSHIHMHIHMHRIYIYMHMHAYAYAYPYAHTHAHTMHTHIYHTYMPTYLHTHIPTYPHTCIYIHIYIHTYIYIYTYRCKRIIIRFETPAQLPGAHPGASAEFMSLDFPALEEKRESRTAFDEGASAPNFLLNGPAFCDILLNCYCKYFSFWMNLSSCFWFAMSAKKKLPKWKQTSRDKSEGPEVLVESLHRSCPEFVEAFPGEALSSFPEISRVLLPGTKYGGLLGATQLFPFIFTNDPFFRRIGDCRPNWVNKRCLTCFFSQLNLAFSFPLAITWCFKTELGRFDQSMVAMVFLLNVLMTVSRLVTEREEKRKENRAHCSWNKTKHEDHT